MPVGRARASIQPWLHASQKESRGALTSQKLEQVISDCLKRRTGSIDICVAFLIIQSSNKLYILYKDKKLHILVEILAILSCNSQNEAHKHNKG